MSIDSKIHLVQEYLPRDIANIIIKEYSAGLPDHIFIGAQVDSAINPKVHCTVIDIDNLFRVCVSHKEDNGETYTGLYPPRLLNPCTCH